ncbi:hypothetical protein ENBRE01_0024 [Enteropsectra breve]|nr:hypothetical protein ENBRE01_0024 [Enteropsectra breve]
MKKTIPVKVDEFRLKESDPYVHLHWSDGTTTWTKLESINCKEQALSFIQKCIKLVHNEAKELKDKARKDKENELLQKIMERNSSKLKESSADEKEITGLVKESTLSGTQRSNNICEKPQSSNYQRFTPSGKAQENVGSRPNAIPRTSFTNSLTLKKYEKHNYLKIFCHGKSACELVFYLDPAVGGFEVDVADVRFLPLKAVAASIYSSYYENSAVFLNVEARRPATSDDSGSFINSLASEKVAGLCVFGGHNWLFYAQDASSGLLNHESRREVCLLKIEPGSNLMKFFSLKKMNLDSSEWGEETFSRAANIFAEMMLSGADLPKNTQIKFIGNTMSYEGKLAGSYLSRINQEHSNRTNLKTAFVVQNSLVDYLHQLHDMNASRENAVQCYILNEWKIKEVMGAPGIVTLTYELVSDCDIIQLISFIAKVGQQSKWGIKVIPAVYKKFKEKVATLRPHEYNTPDSKYCYRLLKQNVCEDVTQEEISKRYSTFYGAGKTYYIIDKSGNGSNVISFAEARKILL